MKDHPYSHMDKDAYRIAYLIAGYIRGTISEKEHEELDNWVNESDHNMLLFEELTDEKNLDANLAWMDKVQTDHSFRKLQESGAFEQSARRFRLNPLWLAAASVLLVAGLFLIYRYSSNKKSTGNPIASAGSNQLKPGGNRATLSLPGGSVIDLTTAKNGVIPSGEGSHVNKPADGELVYDADTSVLELSAFHTLSTPVGGQFQVRLPDGTRVWLNAATTLKYPSHFSGPERRVELEGEAYFEVSKNEKLPFRVQLADSALVTVLGTHFNIMAYKDEQRKEITLLEGRVAVKSRNRAEELSPGMQANITGGDISKRENVDTEAIVGWKNGLFVFHDASIEAIMRQVERWYDAKVVFQGRINQQFNATIYRSEPLSKLLNYLELTREVHFKVENKTIYVLP